MMLLLYIRYSLVTVKNRESILIKVLSFITNYDISLKFTLFYHSKDIQESVDKCIRLCLIG